MNYISNFFRGIGEFLLQLYSSGFIDKICWKCDKRVWFWQERGEMFYVTPCATILSHKNCKESEGK